jgi:hypothetical protein
MPPAIISPSGLVSPADVCRPALPCERASPNSERASRAGLWPAHRRSKTTALKRLSCVGEAGGKSDFSNSELRY